LSKSDVYLAFSFIESDLQAKNLTVLYSDILVRTYDKLSRHINSQPGLPEASRNTAAPISSQDVGPEAASSLSGVSQVGTSLSMSETVLSPVNNDDNDDNGDEDRAMVMHTHTSPAATTFAASLTTWPVFPDTITTLTKLRTSSSLSLKLVVLSNACTFVLTVHEPQDQVFSMSVS
jgi:hypothetical protein